MTIKFKTFKNKKELNLWVLIACLENRLDTHKHLFNANDKKFPSVCCIGMCKRHFAAFQTDFQTCSYYLTIMSYNWKIILATLSSTYAEMMFSERRCIQTTLFSFFSFSIHSIQVLPEKELLPCLVEIIGI